MSPWVILGCGYIGTRLAKSLLADGKRVIVGARNRERLAELANLGAEAHPLEASRAHAFQHLLGSLRSPVVIYSVPLIANVPGGEIVGRAASMAQKVGAARFVYLSSIAVYGEGRNSPPVDEDSPTELSDVEARAFISAEGAVENARGNGLDCLILRLAPVYGPGRGVRQRLLENSYTLLDGGVHVYSRIHVDDVVGVIRTAAERAPANATYCLADDRPTPQKEYTDWLCAHIGAKPPTSVPSLASGMPRRRIRNRAVSNARLKRELGYTFLYPSFQEGELAIDRELQTRREQDGKGQEAHATAPETAAPALAIHRRGEIGSIAERSKLARLSLSELTLPKESRQSIAPGGEAVVYLASGSVLVERGEVREALGAGDAVTVPAGGIEVVGASDEPARVLLVSARL